MMSRPLLVAYDTPYAGSMREREDGAYVRRDDPASLTLALLALTADKDRAIADLEAQRDQLLQEVKELREQLRDHAITAYYSEKSGTGQPPPMPR